MLVALRMLIASSVSDLMVKIRVKNFAVAGSLESRSQSNLTCLDRRYVLNWPRSYETCFNGVEGENHAVKGRENGRVQGNGIKDDEGRMRRMKKKNRKRGRSGR